MKLKSMTENERLFSSVLLVFIFYFTLTSFILLFTGEETTIMTNFRWTISFLTSMLIGTAFFLQTRPTEKDNDRTDRTKDPLERNIEVLKRALKEDETTIVEMIKKAEGVTQDSIRFKTGFSKSKVSAIITELERKDIITREKMGRTYRLHISEWLKKH